MRSGDDDEAAGTDPVHLLARLRAADEDAIRDLVVAWTPGMLRLARAHVPSDAVAEEVVQEAWLAVIQGIARFEGRSSLRTWVYGIVLNHARRSGTRERRAVPVPFPLDAVERDASEPAVDPSRFFAGNPHAGRWSSPPRRWDLLPEEQLGQAELRAVVERAVAELPPRQRDVITARDLLELPAEEVSQLFELSDGNQRVLLHRARTRVRTAVEAYAGAEAGEQSEPDTRVGPLERLRRRAALRGNSEGEVLCHRLVELVTDYLEGALSPDLRARVEEHLDGCGYCRGYVRQVRRLLEVTRALGTAPVDEHVVRQLSTRMEAAARAALSGPGNRGPSVDA